MSLPLSVKNASAQRLFFCKMARANGQYAKTDCQWAMKLLE